MRNIEVGKTLLMRELEKGHLKAVKFLLDSGADPDVKDEQGEAVLLREAAKGHLEAVQILLSSGADPNAREQDL